MTQPAVQVDALLRGRSSVDGSLMDLTVDPDGIAVKDVAAQASLAATVARLEQVVAALAGTLATALPQAQVDALKPLASQPVSGTVGVSNATFPLPAEQVSALAPLASQPVTGPLTRSQLDSAAVTVTGTITATPTGTQAVSGPLTDAQLRAASVPVTTGLTQPLTDTQLRASALPVSGPLTRAQLDSADVATFERHRTPPTTGTLQAVGSTVYLTLNPDDDLSSFSFHVYGFTSGTFVIERTLSAVTGGDPSTIPAAEWTAVGAFKAGTRASRSTWSEPGAFHGNCSASTALRLRVTVALNTAASARLLAGAGTGTVTVGAIASNEGNVIGGVQTLAQVAATAAGGRTGFNASSGAVTTTGQTEQLIAVFRNPAGSGVDLHLDKIALGSLLAGRFRRYRGGTFTPSNSQTASPNVNRGGGANSSVAVLNPRQTNGTVIQTTTTATGGVLGRIDYCPANDERVDKVDGSLILRPGDMQYWTFTPSANTAGECNVDVVWRDVTAAA